MLHLEEKGKEPGICGQSPLDCPEIRALLVENGIVLISPQHTTFCCMHKLEILKPASQINNIYDSDLLPENLFDLITAISVKRIKTEVYLASMTGRLSSKG